MFLKSNSIFSVSSLGFLGYILFWVCIISYRVIIRWKIFKKAGKNGWEALIPIYSSWTLFEISGYPGYLILFVLIPYAGFIILFVFIVFQMKESSILFVLSVLFYIINISLPWTRGGHCPHPFT